jgi:hypothetical protein
VILLPELGVDGFDLLAVQDVLLLFIAQFAQDEVDGHDQSVQGVHDAVD